MDDPVSKKISFKEQQLKLRETLILDTVNELLATKGFDLMTMDEVAAAVGIAKASLYKHFTSKEELAAAAMARLLAETLEVLASYAPETPPVDKLKRIVAWSIEKHLSGKMPLLPSTRSTIRQALMNYPPYMEKLKQVTEQLSAWIWSAQQAGVLAQQLPAEAILYAVFARSCDPVADFLQSSGAYSAEEIVQYLVDMAFNGLAARAAD